VTGVAPAGVVVEGPGLELELQATIKVHRQAPAFAAFARFENRERIAMMISVRFHGCNKS
jgi:hypothetical protein